MEKSQLQQPNIKSFKTIIIGSDAVGKSTLLVRYVDGKFVPQGGTICIDYKYKKVTQQNVSFTLQLWDTPGKQWLLTQFHHQCIHQSKAACVVFDVTCEESLNDTKIWLQLLKLLCGNDIPKILLANMCDKFNSQELQQQLEKFKPTIDKLKEEYHCEFFTISAYNGTNVDNAFGYLARKIYETNNLNKYERNKTAKIDEVKLAINRASSYDQ